MGLELKLTNEETTNIKKNISILSKLDYTIGLLMGIGGGACAYALTGNPVVGVGTGVTFAAPWMYGGYSRSKQINELTQNG